MVIQLFGLDHWLAQRGQDYQALLVFRRGLRLRRLVHLAADLQVDGQDGHGRAGHPAAGQRGRAVAGATVRRHAEKAGIGMPEVGIFDSPEPNAFATGANRNNAALVAVSTGLLRAMRREEVEAVLGHEIAHVANGDMVTLTLIQGVLNTFVIFLARVIGSVVDGAMRGNSESAARGIGYFVTVMVAQIVLGLFASMIVAWFSRQREFRADAGGAHLAGTRLDDRRARSAQARAFP